MPRHTTTALPFLIALANTPALSNAQSTPDRRIEEVVVTGTRSGTPLDSLAISVSVVDEDAITEQLRFDTNIGRALEFTVPGVSAQATGRSACSGTIRGRTTSFQVNGVPVNDDLRRGSCNGAFLVSPFAIERIEVVRGGTALYGAGAPGGIVNLITRRASAEALEVDGTVQSSFNTSDRSGSFVNDLYLGAGQRFDRVDYYVGAGYRELGIPRNAEGGLVPAEEVDGYNLNASLGVAFDNGSTLRFMGTFYREERGASAAVDGSQVAGERFGNVIEVTPHPDRDDALDELLTLSGTYHHPEMLGHTVDVTVFYQDTHIEQRDNFFDVNFGGDFFFATFTDNERLGLRSTAVRTYAFNTSSLKTSYGWDYTDNRFYRPIIDTEQNDRVTGFIAPETILRTSSLFGQLEWERGPFNVSAGVRQEFYSGEVGDKDYSPAISTAGTPGDFEDTDLALFNAGIVYGITAETQVYAGFSQGAEISQLGRATRRLADPSTLSPEPATSDQFEIGVRGTAGAFAYEGAAFYSESDSAALLQVDPACAGEQVCTLIPLRAPQEIYGIEGLVTWSASDRLDLRGIFTWQRGEIFDEDGDNGVSLASDTIVPLRLTAAADWRPLDKLTLGLQATYYGGADLFDAAEEAAGNINPEDQFLINVNAMYQAGPGELYAAIANLLDESYVTIAEQAGGDFSYFLAEGRRVSIGYKVRF